MAKNYPTTEVSRLEIELKKSIKLRDTDIAKSVRFQSKVMHRSQIIDLLKKQLAEAEAYAKSVEVSIGGPHVV